MHPTEHEYKLEGASHVNSTPDTASFTCLKAQSWLQFNRHAPDEFNVLPKMQEMSLTSYPRQFIWVYNRIDEISIKKQLKFVFK